MSDSNQPDVPTPDSPLHDGAIVKVDAAGLDDEKTIDAPAEPTLLPEEEDTGSAPPSSDALYSERASSPTPPVIPDFSDLDYLRSTLNARSPCCWGTLGVSPRNLQLYYGMHDAKFIDFSESPIRPGALEALADACDKAKFGRGNETVLDETYRKAGQMDEENFTIRFDAERVGLMPVVHSSIFPDMDASSEIYALLYKLNVYDQGAFFKPHRDTPRGKNMFGSLVIVLPTPHEGGELVLRHKGREYTFDGAQILSDLSNTISYVAFFSDVEHEVLPIRSGHRVTLTYNLYHGHPDYCFSGLPKQLNVLEPSFANKSSVANILRRLLDNSHFLPHGGVLGFGLRHSYPFEQDDIDPIYDLRSWLKGADAALHDALIDLDIEPHLWLVYDSGDILIRVIPDSLAQDDDQIEDEEYELMSNGGIRFQSRTVGDAAVDEPESSSSDEEDRGSDDEDYDSVIRTVYWAVKVNRRSEVRSQYLYYGNEATNATLYMDVCLLVRVGPFADRDAVDGGWEARKG